MIGLIGITHPPPDPRALLDEWATRHVDARRNAILARDADAGPTGVESQAVIAALDLVADQFPGRERKPTVWAPVVERNRVSGGGAIDHEMLTADRSSEQLRDPPRSHSQPRTTD